MKHVLLALASGIVFAEVFMFFFPPSPPQIMVVLHAESSLAPAAKCEPDTYTYPKDLLMGICKCPDEVRDYHWDRTIVDEMPSSSVFWTE